jgi:small subunit ribosomal protein S16
MALKIRLRKQGRINRQFFRVVVTDTRYPRDGKYIDTLGWYNPYEVKPEQNLFLDAPKLEKWVREGVDVTERVQALMVKAAPEVIKLYREQRQTARTKATAKRRELRRKNAKANKA